MFDIQIKSSALDAQECIDFVTVESAGGMVVFIGTVRDMTKNKKVVGLEFESYEPMALKEMKKIAERAVDQWPIKKISMHHFVGSLGIKGIAVVIAVTTAHRKAAFEACSFCIDTLKETVPIWKKEIFEDGEVWVAAHP